MKARSHTTHRLVLPADLNQFGRLFGGQLLAWVDEACWVAASLDFPQGHFVTMAMKDVVFKKGVESGSILLIESRLQKKGTTSVSYLVQVSQQYPGELEGVCNASSEVFATEMTLVNVDSNGDKKPLPIDS